LVLILKEFLQRIISAVNAVAVGLTRLHNNRTPKHTVDKGCAIPASQKASIGVDHLSCLKVSCLRNFWFIFSEFLW